MRVLSSTPVPAAHVLEAARMASLSREAIRKTVAGRTFSDVDLSWRNTGSGARSGANTLRKFCPPAGSVGGVIP